MQLHASPQHINKPFKNLKLNQPQNHNISSNTKFKTVNIGTKVQNRGNANYKITNAVLHQMLEIEKNENVIENKFNLCTQQVNQSSIQRNYVRSRQKQEAYVFPRTSVLAREALEQNVQINHSAYSESSDLSSILDLDKTKYNLYDQNIGKDKLQKWEEQCMKYGFSRYKSKFIDQKQYNNKVVNFILSSPKMKTVQNPFATVNPISQIPGYSSSQLESRTAAPTAQKISNSPKTLILELKDIKQTVFKKQLNKGSKIMLISAGVPGRAVMRKKIREDMERKRSEDVVKGVKTGGNKQVYNINTNIKQLDKQKPLTNSLSVNKNQFITPKKINLQQIYRYHQKTTTNDKTIIDNSSIMSPNVGKFGYNSNKQKNIQQFQHTKNMYSILQNGQVFPGKKINSVFNNQVNYFSNQNTVNNSINNSLNKNNRHTGQKTKQTSKKKIIVLSASRHGKIKQFGIEQQYKKSELELQSPPKKLIKLGSRSKSKSTQKIREGPNLSPIAGKFSNKNKSNELKKSISSSNLIGKDKETETNWKEKCCLHIRSINIF